MMNSSLPALAFALLVTGCGAEQQPQQPTANSEDPVLPAPSAPPAVRNEISLPEPKGPIDPKSLEAAGQVVQQYGALLEQGRLAEAARLWGDASNANSFARTFAGKQVHLEIGDLGPMEGAAGSSFTTMPVVFYGEGFRRPASVILRRVNDVPGSTEAQRRWHIERIDLRDA